MKTPDVRDRMGVYRSLEDVPDRHRLNSDQNRRNVEGKDVWDEYTDEVVQTGSQAKYYERAGRYWRNHMEERGRHHALAKPEDVIEWSGWLLDDKAITTAYSQYWLKIENFYTWLQYNADYPHNYQPVWMAVIEDEDGPTGELWRHKVRTTEEKDG